MQKQVDQLLKNQLLDVNVLRDGGESGLTLTVSQDQLLCSLQLLNARGIALDKATAPGEITLMQALESDIALNIISTVHVPDVNVNRRDRCGAERSSRHDRRTVNPSRHRNKPAQH